MEEFITQTFPTVLRRNQGVIGRIQDWSEHNLLPQPIHPPLDDRQSVALEGRVPLRLATSEVGHL